jgi:hypothetical protein
MVSEEQKEILKERLKKARIAKIEKKGQIKDINKEKKQPQNVPLAENPTSEDTNEMKPSSVIPSEIPVSKPMDIPIEVKQQVKPPREAKQPKQPSEAKDSKQKYAKLVFYSEPNGKKLKKLSNLITDESDSDNEPPPQKQVVKSKKEIEDDYMIEKMNKETDRLNRLKNLSLHFFN